MNQPKEKQIRVREAVEPVVYEGPDGEQIASSGDFEFDSMVLDMLRREKADSPRLRWRDGILGVVLGTAVTVAVAAAVNVVVTRVFSAEATLETILPVLAAILSGLSTILAILLARYFRKEKQLRPDEQLKAEAPEIYHAVHTDLNSLLERRGSGVPYPSTNGTSA